MNNHTMKQWICFLQFYRLLRGFILVNDSAYIEKQLTVGDCWFSVVTCIVFKVYS